jgi:hypothetical protein
MAAQIGHFTSGAILTSLSLFSSLPPLSRELTEGLPGHMPAHRFWLAPLWFWRWIFWISEVALSFVSGCFLLFRDVRAQKRTLTWTRSGNANPRGCLFSLI